MFTGLIETTAELIGRDIGSNAGKLRVRPAKMFENLERGESIAVNGTCLTLESWSNEGILEFHTLEETLARTNLGSISSGGIVNLERAVQLGGRMGGHIVTGHIDVTAKFIGMTERGEDIEYRVAMPAELKPYMAPKGSIAIDGVSLTLVDITEESFSVHLIPVTLEETSLGNRNPGDLVNLEADLLGKYVQQQIKCYLEKQPNSNVSMETLINAGW